MASVNNKLTPTQKAILCVLADGRPHTREELHACLPSSKGLTAEQRSEMVLYDLGSLSNIQNHISAIRKVVCPQGEDVLCVLHKRTICYRYVKLLNPLARKGLGRA